MAIQVPAVLLDVLVELRPQLDALAAAQIPDGWLGAGAIRNRVWDRIFATPGRMDADWDVPFAGDVSEAEANARLNAALQGPWEAVDQRQFGHADAVQGLASWPETATAIAARCGSDDDIEVIAPWGFDDLLAGRIRPAPTFCDDAAFQARQQQKAWLSRWPALTIAARIPGQAQLAPWSVGVLKP